MNNYEIIKNMVNEFKLVMSKEKMLESYEWFSLASGINDDNLTLEILNIILNS